MAGIKRDALGRFAPKAVSDRFLNNPRGNASGRIRAVLSKRAGDNYRLQRALRQLGPLMRRMKMKVFVE